MNIPSGTLKLNARGQLVKDLQEELKDAGFDPQGADGVFGARTQKALEAFQRAKHLKVDGIAGKQTWTALGGDRFESGSTTSTSKTPPSTGPDAAVRQKIVSTAYGELGVKESGADNHGPAEKYPNYLGRGPEAWCADFVSYVNTKSGNKLNYASAEEMRQHFKSVGKYEPMSKADPKPGDVVFYDWRGNDGRCDHVGVIVDVIRDSKGKVTELVTIEGNAHPDSGGGRQGVYLHHRKVNSGMMGVASI